MDEFRTDNKIAVFGPYIGDLREEVFSFRPFVKWIHDNIEFKSYYLSTHFNRSFLYDFIDGDKIIPVYESLTRGESKQRGVTHKDIHTKEYSSIIIKNITSWIKEYEDCLKKNIINYNLSYSKNLQNISVYNKKFDKIPYEEDENKNKIVFIPDKRENKKFLEAILWYLDKNYKDEYVVVGDEKTFFKNENIIKQRADYFEIVYKMTIDYISNAKMVICPVGHWTLLSNQQNTYVFSWGNNENISLYKTDGLYGFGNDNIIISLQDKNSNKILAHIDKILNYKKR